MAQERGHFCHLLWLDLPENTGAVDRQEKKALMISRPEFRLDELTINHY